MIEYLAPSLEPYKGCTLIDVHPGACLWSAKLHEFLKPKRHILMEPEMNYYDPFIKPLLHQPNSTYRHTTLTGAHARSYWDNYRTILDDPDMCTDRPALAPGDPKLRELDTSILLTGNLCRKYYLGEGINVQNRVDQTPLVLQHMTYAALTNSIFQRSGLVRMLWWAPEDQKAFILPTNVRARKSFDVGLSVGSNVTEVAGVERRELEETRSKSETKRLPAMDGSVQARVQRGMDERGQKIPSDREMPQSAPLPPLEDDAHFRNSITKTTCTSLSELRTALKDFKEHLDAFTEDIEKVQQMLRARDFKKLKFTIVDGDKLIEKNVRYQQAIDCVDSRPKDLYLSKSPQVRLRAVLLLDLQARLVNLESNYAAVAESKPNAKALESIREKILAFDEACTELMQLAPQGAMDSCQLLMEDIMSCEAQTPHLQRDRRAYEPLQARVDEFWPHYPLTLLDLMPHTTDLSAPGVADGVEGARVCQELCKHLFATPAATIAASLDRMAPNAAKDLIPLVPDISDARKGGRLNPHKVTVRMMTPEMMGGLVRAFLEWPFRPSTYEMALQGEWEPKGNEDSEEAAEEH